MLDCPKECRSSSERSSPRQLCSKSLATKAKSLPQCNIIKNHEQLQLISNQQQQSNKQQAVNNCLSNLKNCSTVMTWQPIKNKISNAAVTVPSSTNKLFTGSDTLTCRCRSRTSKDNVILETTC